MHRGMHCRYIPQEVLNDDCTALDKADIFMLGASLYELASGTQLPTGTMLRVSAFKPSLLLYSCGHPSL